MLASVGGQDKAPGAMAKAMSWLVTNAKMALGDDTTAALSGGRRVRHGG